MSPGCLSATALTTSSALLTVLPSTATITSAPRPVESPAFSPAFAAGLPGVTWATSAPLSTGRSSCLASSGVTSPIRTPR